MFQRLTSSIQALQMVSGGFKGFQGRSRCVDVLVGVPRVSKDYRWFQVDTKGLQGRSRGFQGVSDASLGV